MTKLNILFEDKDMIVVDKPSGLIVEKNPFEESMEDHVFDYLQSKSKKTPYLGIVHRLDRVTSGVLVFAKKKSVLRALNQEFSERRVKKVYLAAVPLPLQKEEGVLEHYLSKDQSQKKAVLHRRAVKNAKLSTLSYLTKAKDEDRALLEITPTTGRFHQIRVQLAAMGNPIFGDIKYGGANTNEKHKITLHAWRLTVYHPNKKQRITFHSWPVFWNKLQ